MENSRNGLALIFSVGLLLAACGPGGSPDSAGGNTGAAEDDNVDINALVASADLKRGETLFLQCRACHSLRAGDDGRSRKALGARAVTIRARNDRVVAITLEQQLAVDQGLGAGQDGPSE